MVWSVWVVLVDTLHKTEVAKREDIGSAEGEHKEHLGGPATNAVEFGEFGNDFLVRKGGEVRGINGMPNFGVVANVFGFLSGKATGLEGVFGKCQDALRCDAGGSAAIHLHAVDRCDNAAKDRISGLGTDLLAHNRPNNAAKVCAWRFGGGEGDALAALGGEASAEEVLEDGVDGTEMFQGCLRIKG